jgi:hypothetical protein
MLAEPLAQFEQQKAYDAWEHSCADWFDDPNEGIIAVVTVYFDASENQPTASSPEPHLFHTVGCYLGQIDDWREFRQEWSHELAAKNIPDFHMNKFENARSRTIAGKELEEANPYRGWSRSDFDQFLNKLHQILGRKRGIRQLALEGLGCSVKKSDFKSMLPEQLRDEPECQSEYIFNVAINMGHAAMLADIYKLEGDIHYVFASGDGEGNNIQSWFRSLWKNQAAKKFFRLSKSYSHWGYDFADAAREPAIQAADIAAYEFNKLALHCAENNFMWDEDIVRKSTLNLCREPDNPFPLLLAGERIEKAFQAMMGWKQIFGASHGRIVKPPTMSREEYFEDR